MKRLLVKLYLIIPKKIRNYFGHIPWLGFFRNFFLKQGKSYREVSTFVSKEYESYNVRFEFYGSIKNVAKASSSGIESTLLVNSIKLLNTDKSHNQDCVIIDVGANFGYLSLVWATSVSRNTGHVFAFEPNQAVYNSLVKSINKSGLSNIIRAERKAVGAKVGKSIFYSDNTTSNILKNDNLDNAFEVEMITLDSFCKQSNIARCDLIKIDVDGIELEILKGGLQTMLDLKPIFIVETNNDIRIVKFFKKYNYKVLGMNLEEYNSDDLLPLNIFCIPH